MKCTEAIIAEHAALLERFAEVERVLPQLKSRAEIGAMAALVEGVLGGHADWETDGAFVPSDRALRLMDRFASVAQADKMTLDDLVGSVAASGGYYVACACDKVVANPGTLTGSIGVILSFPTAKGLMEKIGKTIIKYSDRTGLDLINFFNVTVFSFLTGNSDMHLKNFSLITDSGEFIEKSTSSQADNQKYGCGCWLFRK